MEGGLGIGWEVRESRKATASSSFPAARKERRRSSGERDDLRMSQAGSDSARLELGKNGRRTEPDNGDKPAASGKGGILKRRNLL